jgi:katanin p60 ATPase-containing subunit A1
MQVLFDLAKYHAPSTIFFDEFDALASSRDSAGESDASRRLKSELLQQMDGLLSVGQSQFPVFVLAATNLPWWVK